MVHKFIVRGQKVSKDKIAMAKALRSKMTPAETILWQNLRGNRLGGWHFRRQQILYGFIVDFYCHAASLVVEVDGEIHKSQRLADQERDAALAEKGFTILRFSNHEVETALPSVLDKILFACNQTLSHPLLSPALAGEGPGESS